MCGTLKEAIRKAKKEGKPEIFHQKEEEPVAWPTFKKDGEVFHYYVPGAKFYCYVFDKDYESEGS